MRREALRGTRDDTVALGARLAARAGELRFVPCHADPHLGNLVVRGPGEVALVDFDDAVLAPPERDLMFVLGGGVLAGARATPQQQGWFLDGYGRDRVPDEELLRFYRGLRGLRVLEDVAEPAAAVLDLLADPAERATSLGHAEDAAWREVPSG